MTREIECPRVNLWESVPSVVNKKCCYIRKSAKYFVILQKRYRFMKTTAEYLQLLKQFKDTKAAAYGIRKIGLFGSVARGEHQEGSDVDVCFEGLPKGFFAVGGIKVELEQLFGCSVDIVRLRDKMNVYFKEQVMKEVIYV